jgi:hypothetical protein
MLTRTKKLAASAFTSALLFAGLAAPASAQQVGLVNIEIRNVLNNNTVNVVAPISVAANVCDVDVNVLSAQLEQDGETTCTARTGRQELTITNA